MIVLASLALLAIPARPDVPCDLGECDLTQAFRAAKRPGFAWDQAIVSWNLENPGGGGGKGSRREPGAATAPTKWYTLADWSANAAQSSSRLGRTASEDADGDGRHRHPRVLKAPAERLELRATLQDRRQGSSPAPPSADRELLQTPEGAREC